MQYQQKATMSGKAYKPRIKVSFHTKDACYSVDSKALNKHGEILDPTHHLVSVNTQKTLSSPAGYFTISLTGTEWSAYLTPNDVVVIEMGYVGEASLRTVMVGLIDKINRKRMMGADGKPNISMTVTGRDFGKLFVKDTIKFYPEISGKDSSDFFLTDVGWINLMKVFNADSMMKGSPAVIIDNIMRYIFPKLNDSKWALWDKKGKKKQMVSPQQIVRYQLGKLSFFMPFIFTADQFEGALWNLLDRASVKPFSELFIDVREPREAWNSSSMYRAVPHDVEESSGIEKGKLPKGKGFYPSPACTFGEDGSKVVLVLRQTPFDDNLKNRLMHHYVQQEDVIGEDLTKSDDEHYNLFWAGTTVNPLGIDLKRVSPPLLNENDAKRYGLSPLEVEIQGLAVDDYKDPNQAVKALDGLTKDHTARLKAWFEKNHEYYNGSLEIRGNPRIKVGHLIRYPYEAFNMNFYVEGVSQSYQVFGDFTTSLTVTRGMRNDKVVNHKPNLPKPPVKPKPKAKTPTSTFYTVRRGDTLWDIASRHYGDPMKWRIIWEANKSMMVARDKRNSRMPGHWIFPNQKLRLPPK
jgi:LysM repeat protein